MNIKRPRADDDRETPPRRVSARKKNESTIDSACFERPYKRGNKAKKTETTTSPMVNGDSKSQNLCLDTMDQLLETHFMKIPESRRQAKAIRVFRAKKVKRMMSENYQQIGDYPDVMVMASQFQVPKPRERKNLCPGRSVFALSRFRDSQGKFQGNQLNIKQATENSSEHGTEDWCSVNHTTAACSQVDPIGADVSRELMSTSFEEFLSITDRGGSNLWDTANCQNQPEVPKYNVLSLLSWEN